MFELLTQHISTHTHVFVRLECTYKNAMAVILKDQQSSVGKQSEKHGILGKVCSGTKTKLLVASAYVLWFSDFWLHQLEGVK